VANHDTQEFQSLPAPVEEWFVPHAYALLLLRAEGTPCVFYGDLYGTSGPRPRRPAAGGRLARLVAVRKKYAYGKQRDYFDQEDCIGWVRAGHVSKSEGAGVAVLVNSSWEVRWKRMSVGVGHRGETWTDVMGWSSWGEVVIDEFGEGRFPVGPRGISVWTREKAPGREKIDRLVHERIPECQDKGKGGK
jgi:alpha-amylase